jgi:hypothetical protein
MFLGSKALPVHKADNLNAIRQLIVYKMGDHRRIKILLEGLLQE